MKRNSRKRVLSLALVLTMLFTCVGGLSFTASATVTLYDNAEDIGHPTFKNTEGLAELLSVENNGASLSDKDIMMKIYEKDLADGGDSFYMDRVLSRAGVASGNASNGGNADGNTFLTRGRALYMNTSTPSVVGFGGNPAYHQPLGGGNLVTVSFSQNGAAVQTTEQTATRVNQPSNWYSTYTLRNVSNVTLQVTKFIAEQNVAVTAMTLVNSGEEDVELKLTASSPYAAEPGRVVISGVEQDELTGTRMSPSNLTRLNSRLLGDGFTLAENGTSLERSVTVPAGGSVDAKVVFAMTTKEIPESAADYVRFAEMDNLTAIRTQKAEYNLYWAQNIPYINVPNPAVEKAILYRWWSERFNSLDANIPGYDYQYPITIEGVLGYNNAIILTQPMHMQDTKWLRSPYLIYGALLSAGNSSQSSAFLDNPGNRSNWNNHYGQYIAQSGTEAFYVVGGGAEMAENLAYYFGHDATGQLDHYGNHISGQKLITYQNNYMTGNDADTISMAVARGWKATARTPTSGPPPTGPPSSTPCWAIPKRPPSTAAWPIRSNPPFWRSSGATSARSLRPTALPAATVTTPRRPIWSRSPSPTTTTTTPWAWSPPIRNPSPSTARPCGPSRTARNSPSSPCLPPIRLTTRPSPAPTTSPTSTSPFRPGPMRRPTEPMTPPTSTSPAICWA